MPIKTNLAVLGINHGPLKIMEVDLPDPDPYQVVVKQYASGICHSQLHQMQRPRKTPQLMGHESTGSVVKLGSEVRHVQEGDMVIVTWIPRDKVNISRKVQWSSVNLPDGSLATTSNIFTWSEYTILDEQYVVKVPSKTKRDVTSIIGCAVITGAGAVDNTANVKPGNSVAIFGIGGVGLSAIVAAKQIGANPIIAVDLNTEKLELALRFGATHSVNASINDPVKKIHELTPVSGQYDNAKKPVSGADFVFDCVGIQETMKQVVKAARSSNFSVKSGGVAVLVGVPMEDAVLDAKDIMRNEKKFIGSIGGSCQPDRALPKYLKWYHDGILDLESMVTARYSLSQINEATSMLEKGLIKGRAILEFH
tara:strand:+ start:395 stop:1492 length:1098 start_codon:yes stop_codon:yes gene_type:complete